MKIRLKKYLIIVKSRIRSILFASFLLILVSCSAKQKYEYLSFFFDDVPLPDSTSINIDTSKISGKVNILSNNNTTKAETKPVQVEEPVYTHPPVEDNGCSNCHVIENSYALTEKQPMLCYNCHDDFSKKYKYLHGPALIGSCTACHDPHKSSYKPLIKSPGQDLCYYCHKKEAVLKNMIHSGIDDAKCWDCHNPHGGSDITFMK